MGDLRDELPTVSTTTVSTTTVRATTGPVTTAPLRRLAGALAAAALGAAVLAGCGSDDPDATADASDVTEPSADDPGDGAGDAADTDADATTDGDAGTDAGATADGDAGVPEGFEFLDFTATDLRDGSTIDVGALAGQPLVVWFWAPWCTTCIRQTQAIAEVAAERGGEIAIVGIGSQDDLGQMEDFVAEYGIDTFAQIADVDGSLWSRFGGDTSRSTFAFVSADGSVDTTEYGVLSAGEIHEAIDALLA